MWGNGADGEGLAVQASKLKFDSISKTLKEDVGAGSCSPPPNPDPLPHLRRTRGSLLCPLVMDYWDKDGGGGATQQGVPRNKE